MGQAVLYPKAAMEGCAGGILHSRWQGGGLRQPLFSVWEWMGWKAEGDQSWWRTVDTRGWEGYARHLLNCQSHVAAFFFEDLLGLQGLEHKKESRGSHREAGGLGGYSGTGRGGEDRQ